ncbi:Endothelin-converting enzyme 1 [Cyphomyrmex costatus]|uniref:Endothelin-converting enzyme 1 n=1 Tax=Cyphomyrmex costatus TaxID=456900 RepID=A0A195C0F2_9HYME|nr:Endothelin-converting enzyme 1 [Cyphomyrmex costatus]
MQSDSNLNQSSDDDFFNSGPCPSCRLAINKETGRLKWCTGGSEGRRLRVKLMLLIPAVLLPITIVFIALSRFQATTKTPDSHTISVYKLQEQDKEKIEDDIFWPTSRNDVERTTEETEEEDRLLLPDMKTSYVPVDTHPPFQSQSPHRRKRDIDGVLNLQTNSRRSQICNSYRNSINFAVAIADEWDRCVVVMEQHFFSWPNEGVFPSILCQNGPQQVGVVFSSNQAMSFNNNFANVGLEKRSKEESARIQEEKDSFSISINETWLSMADEQVAIINDEMPDLRILWKGEENKKSIREAQARIMLKYMDKSVDPCQDFYQYACGNWAKRNPIPKDKIGHDSFEVVRESLDSVLKELLEDPISRDTAGEIDSDDATVKAKHLFQSCMNYEILEQRMERPLIQLLDQLGGWPILKPNWDPDKFDWLLLTAQLRLYNNDILITEWVGPDMKNSDKYVIQFDQTSLGLPTKDYFLQPSNAIYLKAYKDYLMEIAILLGASSDNATIDVEELIEFETQLASITLSSDERRNSSESYQRMNVDKLSALVQIDWSRYLSIILARPIHFSEPIVIFALQYFQDLVVLLSKTQPRTVANYLLWRFVRNRVNNLDNRFQQVKQKFYYIMFGREEVPSRWKICVTQVNSNMDMAVGSMFVKKYFDENSKNDLKNIHRECFFYRQTLLMTREIQRSFRELLDKTNWIDDELKRLATEKVNAMVLRIGYPDFILQSHVLNECYKDVVIRPDKYFENTLNIIQYLNRMEQAHIGRTVDKTLWDTGPAVVNAYYSRNKNQIIFPAGILQPPFYHRFFPRSLNYGGIGVIIGHEITHGFDDKGRLFDKNGNLHGWWREEAIDGFNRRTQCLIDQYAHYTVTEVGMQIDGVNTQSENIADNGGVKQAFRAYERWLRSNKEEDETLPGITVTAKQLFFLHFAQVWCGSIRPEAARNRLKTSAHSPDRFRVIGTLSNLKDFAQVFNCPPGSPMNPVSKCSVW